VERGCSRPPGRMICRLFQDSSRRLHLGQWIINVDWTADTICIHVSLPAHRPHSLLQPLSQYIISNSNSNSRRRGIRYRSHWLLIHLISQPSRRSRSGQDWDGLDLGFTRFRRDFLYYFCTYCSSVPSTSSSKLWY
jgi:hypothetical protein